MWEHGVAILLIHSSEQKEIENGKYDNPAQLAMTPIHN